MARSPEPTGIDGYVMVEPCPECGGVISGCDVTYGWREGTPPLERLWEPDGPLVPVPSMFPEPMVRVPQADVVLVKPCGDQVDRDWWFSPHELRKVGAVLPD